MDADIITVKLMDIYKRLYEYFGPRHWWPADTPFEVMVGAILTQNVSWVNVEKAISNLKKANVLDVSVMANMDTDELKMLIKPAGFYNQKAIRLKFMCQFILVQYDGSLDKLFKGDVWDIRRVLLSWPGVGPETADAILLYAGNKPIFVVDAYTKRLFGRMGLIKLNDSYNVVQTFFMDALPHDVLLYNEYHALIDEQAKRICLKNRPLCDRCPTSLYCRTLQDGGVLIA